jgi:hypothetical protein
VKKDFTTRFSARKNSVLKPEELDARDHEVKTGLVEKICAIDW